MRSGITKQIERAMTDVWDVASGFGLDPFPTHFEIVPAQMVYEFGAYGIPGRFSHWTHGKAYYNMKTMYDYGLSKIYELVINANPSQAFLLDTNDELENKMVMAHVLGHTDFFKNSAHFAPTNRRMHDAVAASAERIARYEFEHGLLAVERFLDAALAIKEHIAPTPDNAPPRPHPATGPADAPTGTPYDDVLAIGAEAPEPEPEHAHKVPEKPERDVLHFLITHARDLEDWQRDVLSIVHGEMLYFLPQMRTKIMNEGFASLAHERILERYLDKSEDIWEFRRLHSGVLSPSPSRMSINPYYVGFQILKDIERRWNGEQEPGDEPETDWLGDPKPRPTGEGWKKIFEVCETENDITFLRKYLTEPLVKRLDLYTYQRKEVDGQETWVVKSTNWEEVRDEMVDGMTNFGVPVITVEDGDYQRHGELYLKHAHDGKDIDTEYAERVLRAIHRLWGQPVHLETVVEDEPSLLSFDGKENRREAL